METPTRVPPSVSIGPATHRACRFGLGALVGLAVAGASTIFSMSAAEASKPGCSLDRASAMEHTAKAEAESEDSKALRASVDYRRAAGEIVRCALSANPPVARWRLYAAAQEDERQALRADLANGASMPSMITYWTAQLYLFDVAVYQDPDTPRAVRAAALEEWDGWCLASTPQYARGYQRSTCHQMVKRIGKNRDYLLGFVAFSDSFTAQPSAPAAPRSQNRPHVAASRPRPAACARPNVPAGTYRAAEPEMPMFAQQQGITGDVQVRVSLNESSQITDVRIESSPNAILNNSALQATRASSFHTEIRRCKPVAADFIFVVTFSSI
jgi:TonB family protein